MTYLMPARYEFARQPAGIDHPYNYTPTEWICALFVSLYSLSTIIHFVQALHYRLWFLFPTIVLAGVGEIIGWGARLWSSKSPWLLEPFIIQITTTIIAPTPLVAANFVILGQLIVRLGPKYSRLSPLLYTLVFVTADIAALTIQAIGGGQASSAVENNKDLNPGAHVMLAGIIVQMVSILIYMGFALEFVLRFLYDVPLKPNGRRDVHGTHYLDGNAKQMLFSLMFSSTAIFIRAVYRTVELNDGWAGKIIATQRYFNVLDGGMITLAFYTLNIFHPGRLLGPGPAWKREMKLSKSLESEGNQLEKPKGEEISETPSESQV